MHDVSCEEISWAHSHAAEEYTRERDKRDRLLSALPQGRDDSDAAAAELLRCSPCPSRAGRARAGPPVPWGRGRRGP